MARKNRGPFQKKNKDGVWVWAYDLRIGDTRRRGTIGPVSAITKRQAWVTWREVQVEAMLSDKEPKPSKKEQRNT